MRYERLGNKEVVLFEPQEPLQENPEDVRTLFSDYFYHDAAMIGGRDVD